MNTGSELAPQNVERRHLLLCAIALVVGGCADTITDESLAGETVNEPGAEPGDTMQPMPAETGPTPAPAAHRITTVGSGWARTSANTPIFRKDALTSDAVHQYIAWYDDDARVIVARRRLDENVWTSQATGFSGRPSDARVTRTIRSV